MSRSRLIPVAILAFSCSPAAEEQPDDGPGQPDIYVARLSSGADGWTMGRFGNVTDRAGYDNQPHFTPDGAALLYTSGRDGQTDIYRYDLTTSEHTQITATTESEYSATTMPGGNTFSVIQVEADSTQRLWSFDFAGAIRGVVFENVAPVGYHAWAGPNAVAMFVLPVDSQGITLHLADPATGNDRIITAGIGRSLNPIPGRGTISFVDKTSASWTINELDPASGRVTVIAQTIGGSEDHAWTPDGAIVMGSGSSLHFWTPDQGWGAGVDLAGQGIANITRLAVHPRGEWIAVVADGT